MKTRLHRLRQRGRSLFIKIGGTLDYWVTCKIHSRRDTSRGQIYWQDRLRWFLEKWTGRFFGWAWDGSDEEIEAVYNSEIPPFHMSDRQRAELERYDLSQIHASCCRPDCRWEGPLSACHHYRCARCRRTSVWTEPFEAV